MSVKMKTITVTHGWRHQGDPIGAATGYRVDRITDSTDFNPGDILSKKQIDDLCAARDWKVTVGPVQR